MSTSASPSGREWLAAVAGGSSAQLWIVSGAGHIGSSFVATAEYERRITAFFAANLAGR